MGDPRWDTGTSLGKELNTTNTSLERCTIERVIRSVRNAILIEGGLTNTIRTIYFVLKNEGWAGLRQRVGSALRKSDRNDYEEWVKRYDTLDGEARERIRKNIGQLPFHPLISVLMPTHNTPARWLRDAIDSVRGQLYENWELCIADDASADPVTRDVLAKAAAEDERIKVVFRQENGHISAASNSALALCRGEWVALMDHDDLLAEHALFCVAEVITTRPEACLIYSDEDKINEKGLRFDPYFKCDFNRDLFYSHNMISHLGVYKREILEELGGFQEGFEGSQDYDLALRVLECVQTQNIIHIPRVLYHWRRHSSSTASGTASKPYAQKAATRALEEHLGRQGIFADISAEVYGFRLRYTLPSPLPLVSIVVVAGNDVENPERTVERIVQETEYGSLEFLMVARHPFELSSMRIPPNSSITVRSKPFRYSCQAEQLAAINAAVNDCRGEFVALLDGETKMPSSGWLTALLALAAQPDVGAVSAKILNKDGTVEHAGYVLGLGGPAGSAFRRQPGNSPCYFGRAKLISGFSATTGSCMVIKKSRFQQVGGYEEHGLSRAIADVDLCLRLGEAGYRTVLNPNALLIRLETRTCGEPELHPDQQRKDMQFMHERWGEALLADPFYSPNLTLDFEDFSYAWPPRVELL